MEQAETRPGQAPPQQGIELYIQIRNPSEHECVRRPAAVKPQHPRDQLVPAQKPAPVERSALDEHRVLLLEQLHVVPSRPQHRGTGDVGFT
jgi:hypothetical protein